MWETTQFFRSTKMFGFRANWVCLKIGYIPNYSQLIGIMISKTIGFRGTNHFQTHPIVRNPCFSQSDQCGFLQISLHPTASDPQVVRSFQIGIPSCRSTNSTKHSWLVVDLPLWKIWVSQLGWLISQYMEQIKLFQTSNQYRYSIDFWCYHVASIDIL